MLLKVRGQPRLHQLYGFSVNVLSMQPAGEGTIKRAAQLLQAKLQKEGLFDASRKRGLPYPPARIGLITSGQSAAYADFIKVLNARWRGIDIEFIDVQVQGEAAPPQLVAALEQFNALAELPEAIVIIRGGGSAEDLAAFSTELVTRAVAASRVPTLVAIGHETDLSLAELAADRQASTPSNAAELLVPDRAQAIAGVAGTLEQAWQAFTNRLKGDILLKKQLLEVYNPGAALERGNALVMHAESGQLVKAVSSLKPEDRLDIRFSDGTAAASVISVKKAKGL
jgi:exodeoxyribonuclease VII large subunit